MRILFVVGTRPEAIKLAPVIREARRRASAPHEVRVCATAQHREMLDHMLAAFEITVDHDLDVMQPDQTPAQVVAVVTSRLEPIVRMERPDWIVVQGDTTTAFTAALTAFYARVPVAHVEAGLRTGDLARPFPEEGNRRLVTAITRLHCAPTTAARRNLLREGVDPASVVVTGNPVIDALHWALDRPCDLGKLKLNDRLANQGTRLVLVTAHRRESFGKPLQSIAEALAEIAAIYGKSILIVYPVHPNPEVQQPVRTRLEALDNVALVPPLGYIEFVHLLHRADLVLTDSGGLQEEAPALGKPVLVLREVTERPEVVETRAARMVGTDRARIVLETRRLLDDHREYASMSRVVLPFGDGHAAERIVCALHGEEVVPFDITAP